MITEDVDNKVNIRRNISYMRCKYDLILMDCNMPLMDGCETTQKIREYIMSNGFIQPIISAVTGHTEQAYVDKAIKSGMNQVL